MTTATASSSAAPLAAPLTPAEAIYSEGALSVRQAVAFTGLPRSTLYELMAAGLPFSKVKKTRQIPKIALVRLMANGVKGNVETYLDGTGRASA